MCTAVLRAFPLRVRSYTWSLLLVVLGDFGCELCGFVSTVPHVLHVLRELHAVRGSEHFVRHGVQLFGGGVVLRHHVSSVGLLYFSGSTTRSEEHTSELQSLMRISYAVFCFEKN